MSDLPAAPLSDDITDRVAKEIAAQVVDHIRYMYPAAAEAVAWGSAARSIQGVVRNQMAEAARAAEAGQINRCLREMRARRLRFRKVKRAFASGRTLEGEG